MPKYKFLEGGGEMGEMIRSKDWSTTPLGSPGKLPATLKVAVGILRRSPFPMHIIWAPNSFSNITMVTTTDELSGAVRFQ